MNRISIALNPLRRDVTSLIALKVYYVIPPNHTDTTTLPWKGFKK
jgi:hypothetical protein